MATTNFNADNAAIAWMGAFADSTSGGRTLRTFSGVYSEFRVTVTGTAATLSYYSSDTGPITLIVDGTTTAPSLTSGSWSSLTLFTGLSDAAHTVVVRSSGAGTFQVERDTNSGMLQVTGAAPALAVTSGYTFSGRAAVNADQTGGSPVLRLNGMVELLAGDGYTSLRNTRQTRLYAGGGLRFAAACSKIEAWLRTSVPTAWRLFVDGTGQPEVVFYPGGPDYQKVTVATGLDATAAHQYELHLDYPDYEARVTEVILTGGTGFSSRPAARTLLGAMGDSITCNQNTTATLCYMAVLGRALGMDLVNAGIPASRVTTGAGNSPMVARTADLTQYGADMDTIVVCGGVNDILLGVSAATYQADYGTMIASLASGCPNATIWCLGILPNAHASINQSTVTTFRAASQAAVAALGNAKVRYVDTSGWASTLAPGGDYTINFAADKLHPNAAGHAILAQLVGAAISGAAPAAAGVSAGRIGLRL